MRTTGKQCGLAATGDYQPSLRSPWLVAVDAHLHRVHHLRDALPMKTAINLTATRPMAQFLEQRNLRPVLIGPDGESEQWVSSIAQHEGLDYCIAQKERLGDKQVVVTMPACEVKGRDVVLVDDVASTGRTLEAAARQLQDASPASLSVMVTHALFLNDAVQRLQAVGVENIWSCDSIPSRQQPDSPGRIARRGIAGSADSVIRGMHAGPGERDAPGKHRIPASPADR